VSIVKTQSELHAMRYVEELEEYPDLLVVAGGDGIGEPAEIQLFGFPVAS
jgi:diacylglycerol kinase family enzyme